MGGPRSIDGLIKPEISAPGQQILSAQLGSYSKGIKLNRNFYGSTAYSWIHRSYQQYFSTKTPEEKYIKSLIMGQATVLKTRKGKMESISHMGAGRVDSLKKC